MSGVETPSWVHLVGIGGMHMSAIAQILLSEGIAVSGSDLALTPLTDRLEALGAIVHAGHDAANLGDAGLVVTTAAAKRDNPELAEARRRGTPVLMRHEMVARLMQGRIALAIAGAHGKTTTTSLVAFMLKRAGLEPSYLIGGESLDLGGNAAPGAGKHIVVEADEYAGAFLAYHPQIAVVLNIDVDHLDYFGSEAALLDAYRGFMTNVPANGVLIAGADSHRLAALLATCRPALLARVERFSLERDADWRADEIVPEPGGSSFSINSRQGSHGRYRLHLPGRYNVANALAAFAAGHAAGLNDEVMRQAIANFHGAHRRFELIGTAAEITVIDDYAHHPTEVAAMLAAARARYPGRRLVVIFQPHTFSRTQYLLDGFRGCFAEADVLFLLQTFAARETPEAGIDARRLADEVRAPRPHFIETAAEAVSALALELRSGDVCLTVGAGSVTQIGPLLIEEVRRR